MDKLSYSLKKGACFGTNSDGLQQGEVSNSRQNGDEAMSFIYEYLRDLPSFI